MIKSLAIPKKYLFDINANCMIQLGIEVSHQKYVDRVINNLSKSIIGLHLKLDEKSDGSTFINHTFEDPPVFKISNKLKKNIDNKKNTLEQLSDIFIKNYYTPPTTRLGSIGFNGNQIILNISHAVGDGGYFKYIVSKLNSYLIDDNESNHTEIPYFPRESTDIFNNIIDKAPDPASFWWSQPKVNRVYTKNTKKLDKPSQDGKTPCKYITTRIPINQLTNYSDSNTIHNLTNSLLTSLYIATNVHNYSDSSDFQCTDFISMPVCVDLRRYMKPNNIDYSVCNNFSNVIPYSIVDPNDTVASIGHKIKKDMFRLMKNHVDVGNLKTYLKMDLSKKKKIELNPKNGCNVELTYTGPFTFKEPIVDVWSGHSMNIRSSTISLMGFGVVDKNGRNEIVLRLRFPPIVFSDEEAKKMAKSIEFCLKNISDDLTIRKAIEKASNKY